MDRPPPYQPGAEPVVATTASVEVVAGFRVTDSDWEKAKAAATEFLEKMKVVGGEDQE